MNEQKEKQNTTEKTTVFSSVVESEKLGKSLNINEIEKWCRQFEEFNNLNLNDKCHITHQLDNIVKCYDEIFAVNDLGSFLSSVLHNDFIASVCTADSINIKCIVMYAKFLYNMIPMDYMKKLHISTEK
jgi:hypothetical protein